MKHSNYTGASYGLIGPLRRGGSILFVLAIVLLGSGCASTCEFENTLVFMEKNSFQEICMIMNEPAELAGHEYCLRKKVDTTTAQVKK